MPNPFGDTAIAPAEGAQPQANPFGDTPVAPAADAPQPGTAHQANTLWKGLNQFANTVNTSVLSLLDLPADAVNLLAEKTGSDFRLPLDFTESYNNLVYGEGNDPNSLPPGPARTVADAAGTAATFGMGVTPVARSPTVRSLLADIAGLGSTTAAAGGRAVAPELAAALDAPGPAQLPAVRQGARALRPGARQKGREISEAVMRGEGDAAGAGFRMDPQSGTIGRTPGGRESLKQGVEPKTVAMLQTAPRTAKNKMLEMLEVARKGKQNARFESTNRPSDIPGDALMDRVKLLRSVNRQAGEQIDAAARALKGERVDVSPVVDDFLGALREMGIKYNPGNRSLDFSESDIRGLRGIEQSVRRVIRQMEGKGPIDALDVHRMKRILDEQLTYGKNANGLGGRIERELKRLRAGLDQTLDETFPAYNEANTQYAETIGALNALQDVAGRKMDLSGGNADKAVGTLLRRILSNAQSRIPLLDAVTEIDTVARKYGQPGTALIPFRRGARQVKEAAEQVDFDDGLLDQVRFMSTIERLFGTSAETSLQGVLENVENPATRAMMTGDTTEMKVGVARGALNKLRGINEENTMKALEKLLKE